MGSAASRAANAGKRDRIPNVAAVGVGVLVTRDHQILLMRRTNAHGEGTWSSPGGHIDFGETIEQCATREVLEETGLKVEGVRFRGITNDLFPEVGKHYITVWVDATFVSGEAGRNSPREATEVAWFSPDALPHPLFRPLQNLLDGACYPPDARPDW